MMSGYDPRMAMAGGGLAGLLGGIFGDSGSPYKAAQNQYSNFTNDVRNIQNPFLQAGQSAIPNYQEWLKTMQDPTKFMNNLMGQYQQSPFAQYQQQQAMRAAQNMGSASGLTGSTPLMQQAQQNAANISSEDMQNWLSRVLGINQQYGAGNQYLMGQGANSANALTNFYNNMAQQQAEAAYGQKAGENQDFMNLLGGGLSLAGAFL